MIDVIIELHFAHTHSVVAPAFLGLALLLPRTNESPQEEKPKLESARTFSAPRDTIRHNFIRRIVLSGAARYIYGRDKREKLAAATNINRRTSTGTPE